MDYLSPSGLQAIKNHKYVPGCYTPLDNLLNPWWFWATERLPMSMAPNLVTLVGTLHLVVVYGLNWHFTAAGDGTPPPAVMAANAWCLFMYQTLDAMDGKQARRTGNSTPLGQLFDHGCDALGMLSFLSVLNALLGLDPSSWWSFAIQASAQVLFFMAQWTEYHTHVLPTALGPVGVTEVQYSLIVGCLISCFFRESCSAALSAPALDDSALPLNLAIAAMIILGTLLSALAFILAVLNAAETKQPMKALLQLAAVITVAVGSVCGFSQAAYAGYSRMLSLATGLLLTHLTNKMIVFSMAQQDFGGLIQQWIVLVYLGGMAMTRNIVESEEHLHMTMSALLGLMSLNYVGWAVPTILHISNCLEIRIFRITPQKQA